ncbi:uncharacterized protein SAPINGB_P001676 [Magnusiomyces paraingens]|uniref:Uncharacterized protein n=1 Tax=Magnusiomyces paraingens TaxID=2606893 RepID=A0A5E8B746_9ASCO|nr:uncharacterized protein SAPINGB_P001676 [Saprochaete ingens]VVT47367.1 unnamed protein product [Saprochaete ingens]
MIRSLIKESKREIKNNEKQKKKLKKKIEQNGKFTRNEHKRLGPYVCVAFKIPWESLKIPKNDPAVIILSQSDESELEVKSEPLPKVVSEPALPVLYSSERISRMTVEACYTEHFLHLARRSACKTGRRLENRDNGGSLMRKYEQRAKDKVETAMKKTAGGRLLGISSRYYVPRLPPLSERSKIRTAKDFVCEARRVLEGTLFADEEHRNLRQLMFKWKALDVCLDELEALEKQPKRPNGLRIQ